MNFEVKEIALTLQQAIAGYGFRPTEEELINYLRSEVPGWREGFCIIPTLENIYKDNPWDLPRKFNERSVIPSNDQEWWFIYPQTQNQRISRKTPCGYSWKITGPHKDVKAGNDNRKIGSKIPLVFQDGVQTNWVIHEYHLLNNDLNTNYVLCHLKRRRDEKADNSTLESEYGANHLANLESYLLQSDHEDLFSEYMIQDKMDYLIENIERPSVMDLTLVNGLTDEYGQLVSEASEEDENVGYILTDGDLFYDDFFCEDQVQTQYGQASNLHNECPVLRENRRTRTIESLRGVLPLEEKKGMVENKFNGSVVAPKKPVVPPAHTTHVKYFGTYEAPRFEKVKQESRVPSIKPEYVFLDETAARAKSGPISIVRNHRTRTIGSLQGVAPPDQKKDAIQSKFNSSHVSSAKPTELLQKLKTPKMSEPHRIYMNEELRLEKVNKQEIALRNVKTECASLDEGAATAKVLKYRELCSVSNSPRKTESREIEPARKKTNSLITCTRPTTKSKRSSENPPPPNLVNVLIGIFLLFAITCQVLNL